eukprot:jgi/Hompol1/1295/HPOL_005551-RA
MSSAQQKTPHPAKPSAKQPTKQPTKPSAKPSTKPYELPSTLELYGKLAEMRPSERLDAAEALLTALQSFQSIHIHAANQDSAVDSSAAPIDSAASLESQCAPDVVYGLRRLLRGLPSSREGARQGFSVALTE